MFTIETTNRFEKDVKTCHKRKYNIQLIVDVIERLRKTGTLPLIYKPHKLQGNFIGFWEAHIKPDWIIIWDKQDETKTIILVRTGTHSDLF